jgi:hypothetical protein
MQEELLMLWDDTRFTVLFVTHSIPEAVKIGNRILLLSPHPGQVKAELNSLPPAAAYRSVHRGGPGGPHPRHAVRRHGGGRRARLVRSCVRKSSKARVEHRISASSRRS